MELQEVMQKRRAYRSLAKTEITKALIEDLAKHAALAPSCYNNQPWRFVFVTDETVLSDVQKTLSAGNKWAFEASLIVAVCSRQDFDCVVKNRNYFLFDTGMATAYLLLRATELGLVAHPIAGYTEEAVKEALEIPESMTVITLVIIGKQAETFNLTLNEKQIEWEKQRPQRKSPREFAFLDTFKE